MKLEKIELIGFKSFADRTVIQFHPGITCIVGPNGCGKSNIVDAFRWVLGEQSAKVLRGDSMQEIIFNGSESKKPKGMAEVNLYFSFPEPEGNGSESQKTVVVSRRLYRSGESEYLINRTPCRLKDIRDLFLDTGLELRSYSILEQGSVGQIINAKPQDRRFLIEEVAGVMKYKVRRAEAETKLQNARLNLQRVEDILSEVKRQRNSLQRQARKAERYMEIRKTLIDLELKAAKAQLASLRKDLQVAIEALEIDTSAEAGIRKEITTLETKIQEKKNIYTRKLEEFQTLQSRAETLQDEIATKEKRLELIQQERGHIKEQLTRLDSELTGTRDTIRQTEARIRELEETLKDLSSKKQAMESNYYKLLSEAEALRAKTRAVEEELSSLRKEVFSKSDQIGMKNTELSKAFLQLEQVQKRLSQIDREIQEAKRRKSELTEEMVEIQNSVKMLKTQKEELTQQRSYLYNELQDIKNSIAQTNQKTVNLKETLASLRARYSSLKERIYGKVDVDKIQSQGIEILGILSQMIDVPVDIEKAVEAALADRAGGIVIKNKDTLIKTLNSLIDSGTEKVTFMVGSGGSRRTINEPGRLSEMVKATEDVKDLVGLLLGDCVLCDSTEEAVRITESRDNIRAVTREGILVQWGCVISAGSPGEMISLTRQLKDIESQIQQTQAELELAEKEIQSLSEQAETLKDRIRETEAKIVEADKDLSRLESQLENKQDEIDRFDKKASLLEEERTQLLQDREDLNEAIQRLEEELQILNEEKASLQDRINTLSADVETLKDSYQVLTDDITNTKASLEAQKERFQGLSLQQKEAQTRMRSLESRIKAIEAEKQQKSHRLSSLEQEEQQIRQLLKGSLTEIETLKRELSVQNQAIDQLNEDISLAEGSLKDLQKNLQEITSTVHEKEIKKRELELKIEALINSTEDKLGIDLTGEPIDDTEVTTEELQQIDELREKLKAMEPVNLAALDEFKQVEERFRFLSEQHQDITQSIEELEDAIHRINRTTRARLKDALEALNKKFKEVFQRLFDGGTAELRLTSEDILEAGIEIVAQPPGKKLQNINLLSGGEKAMTALALMFGGFLIKPTPICILDEADAPLDENNTHRFIEMLRELARDIQFIVITHNRLTMEAADYLYGVTMDEPGVTKLISYRLTEATN